jgi:hypothetical protein
MDVDVDVDAATEEDGAANEGETGKTPVAAAASICAPASDTALPLEFVPVLAKLVQGSALPLAALAAEVHRVVCEGVAAPDCVWLSQALLVSEIPKVAERKAWGVLCTETVTHNSTAPECMWLWECSLTANMPSALEKQLKARRTVRRKFSARVKAAHKFVTLAEKGARVAEKTMADAANRVDKVEREVVVALQKKEEAARKLREKEAAKSAAKEKKLAVTAAKQKKQVLTAAEKEAKEKEKLDAKVGRRTYTCVCACVCVCFVRDQSPRMCECLLHPSPHHFTTPHPRRTPSWPRSSAKKRPRPWRGRERRRRRR